jgi:two-component system sensor histidine kinase UhpB
MVVAICEKWFRRVKVRLQGVCGLESARLLVRGAADVRLPPLRPIRVYLLILVLGAMLPGALLTGVLVWRAFANHRAVNERRLLESARVDAAALDREFASTMSVLQTLATSPALDRGDVEAFYQEGRRAQSTQPGWYTLALLAPDGRQLVSTRQPLGVTLPQVPELASVERLTATKQPVVGTVVRAPRGGNEHLLPIRVPVIRNGELKYAL